MAVRIRQSLIYLCVALSLFANGAARASLTVELRAVSTTSGTVIDAKHVLFTGGPGDTVTMEVWGIISDNDGIDNEGLGFLQCSMLSSAGGLTGNLAAERSPDFRGALGGDGFIQDLDGDGDLDVGSNNEASMAGFFRAFRSQFAPYVAANYVGRLTWTASGGAAVTEIHARPRATWDGAGWAEDTVSADPSTSPYLAGAAVRLIVPEPATAGACALIAAVLLLCRNRRAAG